MNIPVIFLWIYGAMIATSFWESSVEGRNAWDKGKLGWRVKFTKNYTLTSYHFYLFIVMWPMLLLLPLVINGWDTRLFGILLSAYFSGIVLEDIMWFVVNPVVSLKDFNSTFANYYPWIKIGRFELPAMYFLSIAIALISWRLFWA